MQSEQVSCIQKNRKRSMIWLGMALIMSVGLLCVFRFISPFTFYNNDDVYLQMIVSGDISGTPSPYMIHSHYLLGVLLSTLYKLAPALAWYGLWICFCVGFCIFCITLRILRQCQKMWQVILALSLEGLFSLAVIFPVICREQFTVLAGLTGATALFWALTTDMTVEKVPWKSAGILCVLAVMTYFIRSDVFFMILPFAGLLWIGKYFLTESPVNGKQKILNFLWPMLILLFVFVLLAGIQTAAYAKEEWKEFRKFTQARAVLYDYTGFPDYEANQELYASLGISRESYETFARHYMLLNNPDVTLENLTALSRAAEETYSEQAASKSFAQLLQISMSRFKSSNFRLMSFLIGVLYLGILGHAVLTGRYRNLWQPMLLFGVQTVIWMYLNHKGRFPDRVANCLFLIELFALLSFYLSEVFDRQKIQSAMDSGGFRRTRVSALHFEKWNRWLYLAVMLLCVLLCLHYGKTIVRENAQRSKALLAFSENEQELLEYCNSHEQSYFLVDLYATAYYTKDILAVRTVWPDNLLSLGGWAAKSPLTDEKLSQWGIEDVREAVLDDPKVYVIFGDSSEFTNDYFLEYYESVYPGCTFELKNTLTCKSGTSFLIYQGEMP